MGNNNFECGQNGYRRKFIYFYTLRRHIRRYYRNRCNNNLEPELINNEDEFCANNVAVEEREEENGGESTTNGEMRQIEEEMRQMEEEVQEMKNYEDIYENLNYYLYISIVRIIARLQSKGSMINYYE